VTKSDRSSPGSYRGRCRVFAAEGAAGRQSAVAQWRSGTVAQWHSGTVAQWHSGTVAESNRSAPASSSSPGSYRGRWRVREPEGAPPPHTPVSRI